MNQVTTHRTTPILSRTSGDRVLDRIAPGPGTNEVSAAQRTEDGERPWVDEVSMQVRIAAQYQAADVDWRRGPLTTCRADTAAADRTRHGCAN